MQEDLLQRAEEYIQLARQAVAEGAERDDVRIWRLDLLCDHYQSAADQTRHLRTNIWPLAAPDRENRLTLDQVESVIAWLSEQHKELEAVSTRYRQGHDEVIRLLEGRSG